MTTPVPAAGWFLEGYIGDDRRLVRVTVAPLPFTIGRGTDQSLRLPHPEVSSAHAVIEHDGETLWVRDLGSTNGTFLNRRPVRGQAELKDGDILHFSTLEFRLLHEKSGDTGERTVAFLINDLNLPSKFPPNITGFREMLERRRMSVVFQPIVGLDRLQDGTVPAEVERLAPFAFEALARADVAGLPKKPDQLFAIASSISAADQLSRLMRERAAEEARKLPGSPKVFVNTHPDETRSWQLLDSLESIRQRWPALQLVLEIHETWVTDADHMRDFSRTLTDLGVELAYDDFGAGQARLIELVEAPPAYLKFDRSLVANLDLATSHKVQMVETLVRMVLEFGIAPLAEGIESAAEARICAQLGFKYAQGFLFGRPAPAEFFYGRGAE